MDFQGHRIVVQAEVPEGLESTIFGKGHDIDGETSEPKSAPKTEPKSGSEKRSAAARDIGLKKLGDKFWRKFWRQLWLFGAKFRRPLFGLRNLFLWLW